jgi:ribonuclease J
LNSSDTKTLRLVPLGGLGEIGMNCMILEYEDEIIVLDCGLLFSDLDHFGVEFVIPDFSYLRDRKDKVKAFVITHGHEDHIGAIPFALKAGVDAPVYAPPFASLLIRERLKEYGLENSTDLRTFQMGDCIDFKHFKVKTEPVNHSIVDSVALFVDTPIGKIIHTGDFKIDPTPFYGRMVNLDAFGQAGKEGVLLLMSDSTNVERHEHSMSESVIYQKFEQLFTTAQGLTVIAMFASNVGRMGQVFELAAKMGKRVALAGRGVERNVQLAMERGYLQNAQSVLIGLDDIHSYLRKDVIVLSTGSQAEQGSALARVAQGDHRQLEIEHGDLIVLSSRYIPGNEKAIGRMINNLFKQGAEVLYETVRNIRVFGHATRPELKQMLELVKPRYFIPVHGEYRHLVHHRSVAKEAGIRPENIVIAVNGDVIELGDAGIAVVDHMEEPRVLVGGREGHDVSKLILRERRHLGEKGVVFSLMVRNAESGKIISGPEIITKGLANESIEGWLVEEAKTLVCQVVQNYEKELRSGAPEMDLQETVRVELRRFFSQNIGKKPIVLPIILDL